MRLSGCWLEWASRKKDLGFRLELERNSSWGEGEERRGWRVEKERKEENGRLEGG